MNRSLHFKARSRGQSECSNVEPPPLWSCEPAIHLRHNPWCSEDAALERHDPEPGLDNQRIDLTVDVAATTNAATPPKWIQPGLGASLLSDRRCARVRERSSFRPHGEPGEFQSARTPDLRLCKGSESSRRSRTGPLGTADAPRPVGRAQPESHHEHCRERRTALTAAR
jgi:hypothetical protein